MVQDLRFTFLYVQTCPSYNIMAIHDVEILVSAKTVNPPHYSTFWKHPLLLLPSVRSHLGWIFMDYWMGQVVGKNTSTSAKDRSLMSQPIEML